MFNLTIDKEIRLRTLHPDDAEELFNVLEQNRARLRPWIDPSAFPETLKATRQYTIECFFNSLGNPMEAITRYDDYFRELDHFFPPVNPPMEMGIWVESHLAGAISLSRLTDSFTAAEFGYWLAERDERKGIITRCVRVLMDYAIDTMKIERFVIGCAATNRRSRSVAERLGYRLYATIPDGEVVGEFIYDRVIYEIRSTAWRERKQASAENI